MPGSSNITTREPELWVGYYKKASGKPSMTWPESVDEALCFGWIDGVRKSIDDERYMIRFTPRRAGSNWSAVNIGRVAALTDAGRMQPAGLKAFEARREDRSGSTPTSSATRRCSMPAYEKRFRAKKSAWAWFGAQPRGYRQAAIRWVMTAKQEETRERRLATLDRGLRGRAQGHRAAARVRSAAGTAEGRSRGRR